VDTGYARVGNAVIIITRDGEGRITAKEDTGEQIAEMELFNASGMLGESTITKLVEEAYAEITLSFKQNIKDTVAKSLGFELDRWGRGNVEVDHCNGRISDVSRVIDTQVREYVQRISKEAIPFDDEMKKKLQKAVVKDFDSRLRSGVEKAMNEKAQSLINEQVEAFMEKAARPMVDKMIENKLKELVQQRLKNEE
jgi:hypothetical protein